MLESLVFHDQTKAYLFHAMTEWLALSGGFMLYNHLRKHNGRPSMLANKSGIWVLIFCLLGAGTGNKLVFGTNESTAILAGGHIGAKRGRWITGWLDWCRDWQKNRRDSVAYG